MIAREGKAGKLKNLTEKDPTSRLLKNAQIQGARNPEE
jgi:hypothetical protein